MPKVSIEKVEIGNCTLYCGDCMDILPTLDKGSIDVVVTDPPYGIASVWKGGFSSFHGWAKAGNHKDLRNSWDNKPPSQENLSLILSKTKDAIIWGGNYFNLPISRGWLVWNKPERGFTLSEAELAWTTRDNVIRVIDLPRSEVDREHPTQKPLKLMRWCLEFFQNASTVLDPYMGSGTTGVACIQTGQLFVGIEVNREYFEIAIRRIKRAVLDSNAREVPLFE